MAKERCPYCREKIRTDAIKCKHCGSDVSEYMSKKKTKRGKTFLILIGILFGLYIISQFTNQTTQQREPSSAQKEFVKKPQVEINEKNVLSNSYFGNFRNGKKEKVRGKITLKVWEPHILYSKNLPPMMRNVMLEGIEKLEVDYDEIWTWINDEGLTTAEKKKFKGQNDISKIYWKQNKVQACTIEKYYVGNPFTGQKFSKPSHKIWNIYDRDYILKKLSEK